MKPSYADIARDGLWRNNAGLVQLLGLCPLLAVSDTIINGFGLGIATLMVLTASNVTISLIRHAVVQEVRIPVFVMIIGTFVTAVELITNAYFHDLFRVLGIFIPLIVTNCMILARAETFASRRGPLQSAVDGIMTGLGFALVLITLGGLRELLGHGTLFRHADMIFGANATAGGWLLFDEPRGFLLVLMPPGAFIGLGLLIALKNVIDKRRVREVMTPALGKAGEQHA